MGVFYDSEQTKETNQTEKKQIFYCSSSATNKINNLQINECVFVPENETNAEMLNIQTQFKQ